MELLFLVSLIITAYSVLKEQRRFRNGIYLLITCILLWGVIATNTHNDLLLLGMLLIMLIGIPLSLVLLPFLLMYDSLLLIRKEGFGWHRLLPFAVGCFLLLMYVSPILVILIAQEVRAILAFSLLILLFALYFGMTFASFLLYSGFYSLLPKNVKASYIIIHGCGLNKEGKVTPLLKGRCDQAIQLYRKGKGKASFVASGGKGVDEVNSEAFAIQEYLISQGISSNQIILEDQSKSTYENLKYTKELLDQRNEPYSCIFVTSNYHVFRTSMLARKLHLKAQGVGCKTAMYYWPNAFLREYIAIVVGYKWNLIFIILLWLVLVIVPLYCLHY